MQNNKQIWMLSSKIKKIFFRHTAKSLPSAKKHMAKKISENLFLKNMKQKI